MNLIKYRALLKIAELGNISRAAEALGYSQPGVSRMLESVENETGFPVFVRSKQGFRPTPEGAEILAQCRDLVQRGDALQETIDEINGLERGTIAIGAANSMLVRFVPRVVRTFLGLHPGMEVSILEMAYLDTRAALREGQIHCGFGSRDALEPFDFLPLYRDPILLVLPEGSPLAGLPEVPLRELSNLPVIRPIPGWDDLYNIVVERAPAPPKEVHRIASDIAALAMVQNGFGAYFLSEQLTGILPEGVAARKIEGNPCRMMGIGLLSKKHCSPAMRRLIRICREEAEKTFGPLPNEKETER